MRAIAALALVLGLLVAAPAPAPAGNATTAAVVYVSATEDSVSASIGLATPGKVNFYVSGNGTVCLVQLKGSYTLDKLYADFAHVFSGKTAPIKRMNQGATFYGGMFGGTDNADNVFGVDLAAGVYYLADLGNKHAQTFEVTGTPEDRTMPPMPSVSYTKRGITMPKSMPQGGWLQVANKTGEISLMDLVHAKNGTTRKQVKGYFGSRGKKFANRFTSTFDSTLILSPGQTYWWSYSLPQGPTVAASLWPREKDTEPQAFHGMWGMTSLK